MTKSGRELNIARGGLAVAVAVAVLGAMLGQQQKASATPAYAKKEKKPCAYCHVNPSGGGKRNAAGIYYGTHNHSFAGYAPAGGASPSPAPKKPTPKPKKAK